MGISPSILNELIMPGDKIGVIQEDSSDIFYQHIPSFRDSVVSIACCN